MLEGHDTQYVSLHPLDASQYTGQCKEVSAENEYRDNHASKTRAVSGDSSRWLQLRQTINLAGRLLCGTLPISTSLLMEKKQPTYPRHTHKSKDTHALTHRHKYANNNRNTTHRNFNLSHPQTAIPSTILADTNKDINARLFDDSVIFHLMPQTTVQI